MPENKPKRKLPKGFIDPMDTTKSWKPAGVKEIFGTASDVFGMRKKTKEEPEEDTEAGEEGDGEDKDD